MGAHGRAARRADAAHGEASARGSEVESGRGGAAALERAQGAVRMPNRRERADGSANGDVR
jgi:hypothetical protein